MDGEDEMDRLVAIAVAEMRAAKGDEVLERAAVCRWFKRGATAGFSTELLVDLLVISSNVLDGAGYGDEEGLRVMEEIVTDISDEEIAHAPLDG